MGISHCIQSPNSSYASHNPSPFYLLFHLISVLISFAAEANNPQILVAYISITLYVDFGLPLQSGSIPHFKKYFIHLFLEREGKGGRRRGREASIVCLLCPLTRDGTRNPGMCPDWESNWWPFALWGNVQPTEPDRSGLHMFFFWDPDLRSSLYLDLPFA